MTTNTVLTELSDQEVIAMYHKILDYCSGWIKCQDGSYEMALHNAGFNEVNDEMFKRNLKAK